MSQKRVPPPFPQPFVPAGTTNPPPYTVGSSEQCPIGHEQGSVYPPESTFVLNSLHSRYSRSTPFLPIVSSSWARRYSERRTTPDTSVVISIWTWTCSRTPTYSRFSSNPSGISDASNTTPSCTHYIWSAAAAATTTNGAVERVYAHA